VGASNGRLDTAFREQELAGSSSVTLVEDDISTRLTEIRAARYDIKKLVDSERIKVAIIEDADGNEVAFVQRKA